MAKGGSAGQADGESHELRLHHGQEVQSSAELEAAFLVSPYQHLKPTETEGWPDEQAVLPGERKVSKKELQQECFQDERSYQRESLSKRVVLPRKRHAKAALISEDLP